MSDLSNRWVPRRLPKKSDSGTMQWLVVVEHIVEVNLGRIKWLIRFQGAVIQKQQIRKSSLYVPLLSRVSEYFLAYDIFKISLAPSDPFWTGDMDVLWDHLLGFRSHWCIQYNKGVLICQLFKTIEPNTLMFKMCVLFSYQRNHSWIVLHRLTKSP